MKSNRIILHFNGHFKSEAVLEFAFSIQVNVVPRLKVILRHTNKGIRAKLRKIIRNHLHQISDLHHLTSEQKTTIPLRKLLKQKPPNTDMVQQVILKFRTPK